MRLDSSGVTGLRELHGNYGPSWTYLFIEPLENLRLLGGRAVLALLDFVRKVVEVELSGSGKVFESAADDILPARYSGMANDKGNLILVISINSSGIPGSQVLNVTTGPVELMAKGKLPVKETVDSHKDASSLSSLSVQLSQSAALAAARDSSLSRKELGAKASELLSKISGDGYFANKKANDAEVPDTQDPVLLARASNATQFVNGSGKNPFAGMSSDQLSLIIYDDSGSFTTNERRAA